MITIQIIEAEGQEVAVADTAEEIPAGVLEAVGISADHRCIMPNARIAEKIAKFHSDRQETGRFIAATASKKEVIVTVGEGDLITEVFKDLILLKDALILPQEEMAGNPE